LRTSRRISIEQVNLIENLAIVLKWYLKYKGIQIPEQTFEEQERSAVKQTEFSAKTPEKQKKKIVTVLTALALVIVTVVVLKLLNVIDTGLIKSGISNLDKSVAVLPFRNDSPDTTNAYFIDGLWKVLNNLRIGDKGCSRI
jgi:hypothetical protein